MFNSILLGGGKGIPFPTQDKFKVYEINYGRNLNVIAEDIAGRGKGAVLSPIIREETGYYIYGFKVVNPGAGYIKPRVKITYKVGTFGSALHTSYWELK
jgi:hypothetical protein